MSPRPNATADAFCAAAAASWRERGSRQTHVREILCRVIARQSAPFTAEKLLPLARAADRGISQASVYRTLTDLKAFGLLHESRGAQDENCYSVVPPNGLTGITTAATLICRDCGGLHRLDDQCLALREGFIAKQAGFQPRKLDLRIEADCETLRATGHCDHRDRANAANPAAAR